MISVIMPAYNASSFVAEAIESILDQTYPDFELIVVDDGSTDNTVDIIQSYVEKDDRVRLIQNEHQGGNVARNTAIENAKYPWIACLDSDDVALPQRLKKQIEAAKSNPDVVVWGSYMYQINVTGDIIGKIQVGPTTISEFNALDRTKTPIMVINPSAMFKRDIAIQVGCYNETLPAAQEIELWDRMSAHGPAVVIPEPLVKYRLHGESVSATKFFDQRKFIRYVTERYKARQEGHELSIEEYTTEYDNKPPLERFLRYMGDKGIYYYRNTGVLLSSKRYPQAAMSLALSVLHNPKFAMKRIWNRFFPQRFT